ncbi:hypothetical protein [Streptomyces sp. NRRL S-378]|uniref:hypothetical protein n=1 Tax=Streptomyces sp. NRRL S-378 TaxID=1463904 RepID=UPI0004C91A94|nr:hypothetical protein [Streptomyces sp. NRRL S-378]
MTRTDPALSPAAQDDEEKLSRMDLLSSAYGFISSREWPDGYGVHDVISVARFLETEDED